MLLWNIRERKAELMKPKIRFEIFEGYGKRWNSYPYKQFSCYSRKLESGSVKTVVLENVILF